MSAVVQYVESDTRRERKGVVVDRELERIYHVQGSVSVDTVLTEAENPESPLHKYFEWDDQAAGIKYRKVQAYSLIAGSKFVVQLVEQGAVDIKTVKSSTQVRKLVSAFRGEGFRLRTEALADADSRQSIIESKKSVLRSWCNSSVDIEELGDLRQLILSHL